MYTAINTQFNTLDDNISVKNNILNKVANANEDQ